ncbi:EARP and GARP complex-interacting protein 1 isoform X4 [Kogia breviceps]|uniref:EARP and GARP complex-interacting protein 1 isoform X4 n=1 Tax=Kogia breviceps TaxID=27615 RepID=UPI0034D261E5
MGHKEFRFGAAGPGGNKWTLRWGAPAPETGLRRVSRRSMEDDAPVIYGLEFQARALTPQTAETDAIRFLVGTQSLKYDNQIHIIDFDDENNIINKNVLLHQAGEIWHISASPADKGVLATCYNKTADGKVVTCAAVWRMPAELEPGGHESPEDAASPAHALELLCHLGPAAHGSTACVAWEPAGDGKRVISLADNHILLWDLQESSSQAVLASSASLEGKGQLKFTTGRWSPHHNCTQVATANDTAVRGWDMRTMSQIYCIESAHGQLVRDLDFNPNKQYYLASCGDDCRVKFWDTRNVTEPVKTLEEHSHWSRPRTTLQSELFPRRRADELPAGQQTHAARPVNKPRRRSSYTSQSRPRPASPQLTHQPAQIHV